MTNSALTLYFDGKCQFCRAGMARLAAWDKQRRLAFVDIADPAFDAALLGVDMASLNRELYAQTPDGRLLRGLEGITAAYQLVGQGWRVAWMRWPLLRRLMSSLYLLFARHRYRMSRWLGYRAPQCEEGVCPLPFHVKEH